MLRKLELRDAKPMLAWMHDAEVTQYLNADFQAKSLQDCEEFIINSLTTKENLNLAIANDSGEYLGTVSLKHIDKHNAEFAIVLSRDAWGKGYAKQAMKDIFKIAFEEYKLDEVYWNVLDKNQKAKKLYNAGGYEIVRIPTKKMLLTAPKQYESSDLLFYRVTRNRYNIVK